MEVDLFASTSKVKILNADTQEVIMEHPLRSLSYIADIGDILVLIAKRKVIFHRKNAVTLIKNGSLGNGRI